MTAIDKYVEAIKNYKKIGGSIDDAIVIAETLLKEAVEREKQSLYTEEQVREAYYQGAADVHDKCIHRTWRGVETKVDIELLKKLNAEYIQSLKQPKKD
jgi:hypothetical protein